MFPKALGNNISIKGEAEVEDTLKLMERKLPEASREVSKIARRLKGNDIYKTCSNLWHFLYEHVQYKPDTLGVEQVRSPKRTWADRESGVDCDCYSMFVGAVLASLRIPFVWRITKYPKVPPEVPRWQHIYPIVPYDWNDWDAGDDSTYITVDVVKDGFDEEEPYLERKDFKMRLEYLEGLDEDEINTHFEGVDGSDLAAYDDEDLGNIFKKIGKGIKNAAKSVQKTVQHHQRNLQKIAAHQQRNISKIAQHQARNISGKAKQFAKFADKVGGAAIRAVNRFANPATILLRNGFLLAMKENMFNVAGRLKFAYLSDAEARKRGMNMSALASLRNVKDKAETIYWQAGGLKVNLKKAILTGNGNKGRDVPMSGLEGLGNIYADQDEYNIIHGNGVNGLGEIASASALAAASSVVGTLAAVISKIKGLFPGKKDEETNNNSGGGNSAPAEAYNPATTSAAGPVSPAIAPESEPVFTNITSSPAIFQQPPQTNSYTGSSSSAYAPTENNQVSVSDPVISQPQSAMPNQSVMREDASAASMVPATTTTTDTSAGSTAKEGFMDKVKKNPWPYIIGAGVVAGGSYMLLKKDKPQRGGGLGSLSYYPAKKHKKKKVNKSNSRKGQGKKKSKNARRPRVQTFNLR